MEHTKGQLTEDGTYIWDVANDIVCTTAHVRGLSAEKQEANAQELVRRWNAFEEDGSMSKLLEACKDMITCCAGRDIGTLSNQAAVVLGLSMKKAGAAIAAAEKG